MISFYKILLYIYTYVLHIIIYYIIFLSNDGRVVLLVQCNRIFNITRYYRLCVNYTFFNVLQSVGRRLETFTKAYNWFNFYRLLQRVFTIAPRPSVARTLPWQPWRHFVIHHNTLPYTQVKQYFNFKSLFRVKYGLLFDHV